MNESKWNELISAIEELHCSYTIFTKSQDKQNLIKLESNLITVATARDWKKYNEIKQVKIEATYNALITEKKLTQNYIQKALNNKRSAFTMAALELLPEVEYDAEDNALFYKMQN